MCGKVNLFGEFKNKACVDIEKNNHRYCKKDGKWQEICDMIGKQKTYS